MKKKGFTLIEMLVVLALLAIIMLIAIPSVLKIRNTQSKKEYDTHVKLMKQALDAYTIKYQSQLRTYKSESTCMILDYKKLINTEMLSEKGIGCDGKVVLTAKDNNSFDYTYFLNCKNENNIEFSHYEESDLPTGCIVMADRESGDATLKDLAIADVTLSPAFNKDVLNYTANVDNTVVNLNITAVPNDNTATVKVFGGSELRAGNNEVTIRVVAEDGTRKDYKIVVKKAKSSLALLSSLTADVCTLEEDPEDEKYKCTVGNDITLANIMAVPQGTGSTVDGTGVRELVVGSNPITITVTSEDGQESKEYYVDITRDPNADTRLASLSSDVCEMSFDKDTREYLCTVGNDITQINVSAREYKNTSTVVGTGVHELNVGVNDVEIKVIAENGTEGKYTIKVTRLSNANARLAALSISNCELSPAFNKEIKVYACKDEVGSLIKEVEVEATAEQETSRVLGTGTKTLNLGRNLIEVLVTAEDGSTTETYQVAMIKKANSNPYLSSLTITGYEITPAFNRNVTEYSMVVENRSNELEVNYEKEYEATTVTLQGNSNVPVGDSILKVKSLAEDELTEIIYTIHVHRKSNDATLASLGITGYSLDKEYNSNEENYRIVVENAITEVNPVYEKNHNLQTVEVTGNTGLVVGDNPVRYKVTAEDGTEKIYTVIVHKKSNDITLNSLSVKDQIISPVFEKETLEYNVVVENNIKNVEVLYDKGYDLQTVEVIGNTGLRVGDTDVLVKVKSEDEHERIYTIHVHRKSNDVKLKNLGVTGYELDKEFEKEELAYGITTENNVDEVQVVYEKNHDLQTVEITGYNNLEVGDNEVQVKVIAEDLSEGIYTINVHKKSNDATLKSLSVTGYNLDKEFDKEEENYKAIIEYTKTSVVVNYETTNEYAKVTMPSTENLEVGNNILNIVVEAEDGTEKTYKLNVRRKSNDARLKAINISGCELPDFDKDQKHYECEVLYSYATVTVEGVLNYEGGHVTSGDGEFPIDWGTTEFKIEVAAEDDRYTDEYTVEVTKNRDTRTALSYLNVKDYRIVTIDEEPFDSDIHEYYVDTESTTLTIEAEAESDVATIVGLDTFDIGWETREVEILVTSQNGETDTYRITINNIQPDEPVLKVDTLKWVIDQVVVDVEDHGSGVSGLDHYEYYMTLSNDLPTASTVPTGETGFVVEVIQPENPEEPEEPEEPEDPEDPENPDDPGNSENGEGTMVRDSTLTITDEGVWHVYYRTVTMNGNRSEWSEGVVAKLDRTGPEAPILRVTSGTEGLDGWYTSDIVLTSTNGTDGASGYSKSMYTLSGATTLETETLVAHNGTITISNEGITKVTLYGYDVLGNKGEKREYTFKIDKTPPSSPTLEVTSGTEGTNNWYSTDIGVTVSMANMTNISKLTYTLSGDTTKAETEIENNGVITIVNNGTTTISAYAYDQAGNKSLAATFDAKKDVLGPFAQTLSSAKAEETKVTATYEEALSLSGVKEYKCYYGESDDTVTSLGTVSGTTCTFNSNRTNQTYTYYFKICATSNSNVTTCSNISSLRYYAPPTITIASSQISNGSVQAASNQKANITWNIKASSGDNETYTFKTIDYYNQDDKSKSESSVANGVNYTFSKTYNTGRHLLMVEATNSNGDKSYESFFFIVREYGQTSGGLSGISMSGGQTLDVQDPGVYDSEGNPLSYVSGFTITVPQIPGHSSGNQDTFDLYGWNGTSWVNILHFNTDDGRCKVTLNDKATSGTWQSSSSSGTFTYPQQTYYKMKFVYWNAHASCVANATNAASYSISYEFVSNLGTVIGGGTSSGTGEGSGETGTVDMSTLFNF